MAQEIEPSRRRATSEPVNEAPSAWWTVGGPAPLLVEAR
jgi:hypothetical protein